MAGRKTTHTVQESTRVVLEVLAQGTNYASSKLMQTVTSSAVDIGYPARKETAFMDMQSRITLK